MGYAVASRRSKGYHVASSSVVCHKDDETNLAHVSCRVGKLGVREYDQMGGVEFQRGVCESGCGGGCQVFDHLVEGFQVVGR